MSFHHPLIASVVACCTLAAGAAFAQATPSQSPPAQNTVPAQAATPQQQAQQQQLQQQQEMQQQRQQELQRQQQNLQQGAKSNADRAMHPQPNPTSNPAPASSIH